MQLKNTKNSYGILSILLHWIMAVLIIGIFLLGEYMVDLTYYDAWYIAAPDLHRSFGMVVLLLLVLRFAWRISNIHPNGVGQKWEQYIARLVHRLFYILILSITISGYLITTADGQAISVFGWFDVPATIYGFSNQEDLAGEVHEVLTYALVVLVVLHSIAALKHHFINHDSTLRRMLRTK